MQNDTYKASRNTIAWLLLSQFFVVLPHMERIPVWVLLAYFLAVAFRVALYRGYMGPPKMLFKLFLVCCSLAGVFFSYKTLLGLDPATALLLAGFSLKLVETNHRRDIYLLIYLGYFVTMTNLLFSQTMGAAVYVFVCVILITSALVAMHQPSKQRMQWQSLRISSVIVLQAIPLMLLLFVVFPRVGPFWKVPLSSGQAFSGMSDSMAPGDIVNLSKSDKLAFRVAFDTDVPPQQALYWRAMTLSDFDGRRWKVSDWGRELSPSYKIPSKPASLSASDNNYYRYKVIQEPSGKPWIYTIPTAFSDSRNVYRSNDNSLFAGADIIERRQYDIVSYPNYTISQRLPGWQRGIETDLPDSINPKSRKLAQQWYRDSGYDTMQYVDSVLAHFRQQSFFYTLQPKALGSDSVDDFLLQTREGFCEHYASAFVFLMRAVNIPARVVVGYQGGEVNPHSESVTVRQYDAHAWTEVWDDNQQSWHRVDPTAAVAPDRVRLGLESALGDSQDFLAGLPVGAIKFKRIELLNELRLRLEALDYLWTRWVLQFDSNIQYGLLQRLLGDISPWRIAIFLLLGAALSLLGVAIQLALSGRAQKRDPVSKAYLSFCRTMANKGCARRSGEGPLDYQRRLLAELPDHTVLIQQQTQAFVDQKYLS